MAGGGAEGDGAAEGVAGQGEGVQALGDGGGDELVGQVVQLQRCGGAGGVAAAGVVDTDDGVAGGQALKDRAVGTGHAAAGAVGEGEAGAGTQDGAGEGRFGQSAC